MNPPAPSRATLSLAVRSCLPQHALDLGAGKNGLPFFSWHPFYGAKWWSTRSHGHDEEGGINAQYNGVVTSREL